MTQSLSTPSIESSFDKQSHSLRRASLTYALEAIRFGAMDDAREICTALAEKSVADADWLHYFAAQRLLAQMDVGSSTPIDAASLEANLAGPASHQRDLYQACELHRVGKSIEAVAMIRSVCESHGCWILRAETRKPSLSTNAAWNGRCEMHAVWLRFSLARNQAHASKKLGELYC
jgi:hypothetical protein